MINPINQFQTKMGGPAFFEWCVGIDTSEGITQKSNSSGVKIKQKKEWDK